MMEDQQQAQSASVSRPDDAQSDDALSVDARFFVAQAKKRCPQSSTSSPA
jgi:hypothetical protein